MGDRASARLPTRNAVPTLASAAVAILVGMAIWLFPSTMTWLTRVLITTTLIPLVVYQTILTILGLRGRENGPASERHAWLENAAVTALCLGLVAAVWSF